MQEHNAVGFRVCHPRPSSAFGSGCRQAALSACLVLSSDPTICLVISLLPRDMNEGTYCGKDIAFGPP